MSFTTKAIILSVVAVSAKEHIALPQEIEVGAVEGTGKLLLDISNHTYDPHWQQSCADALYFIHNTLNLVTDRLDFVVTDRIRRQALSGGSASLTLTLLLLGAITRKQLSAGLFTTGFLNPEDGGIGGGKFAETKAKAVADYADAMNIKQPVFLIPYAAGEFSMPLIHVKRVHHINEVIQAAWPDFFVERPACDTQ